VLPSLLQGSTARCNRILKAIRSFETRESNNENFESTRCSPTPVASLRATSVGEPLVFPKFSYFPRLFEKIVWPREYNSIWQLPWQVEVQQLAREHRVLTLAALRAQQTRIPTSALVVGIQVVWMVSVGWGKQ
jgi:hypothetical protein